MVDLRDQLVKYIGQTINPSVRYSDHIHDRRITLKSSWIKFLLKRNLYPIMIILDECNKEQLNEREKWWIAWYKKMIKS